MRTNGSKDQRYVYASLSSKPAIILKRLLTYVDQVNIEHQMLGREGNVVEGMEHDSGDSSAGSLTKDDRAMDDMKAAHLA